MYDVLRLLPPGTKFVPQHDSWEQFLTIFPEILSAFFCWFCLFCIGLLMRLRQRQLDGALLICIKVLIGNAAFHCLVFKNLKSFCDALWKYNRLFPLLLGGFNWINSRSCCFHCRARLPSTLRSLPGLNQLKKKCYFKLQQEGKMLRIKAETKAVAAQRSWRPVLPFLPSRAMDYVWPPSPPPTATLPIRDLTSCSTDHETPRWDLSHLSPPTALHLPGSILRETRESPKRALIPAEIDLLS